MNDRMPISEGAMTALRALADEIAHSPDAPWDRYLSALLDRMEAIDPQQVRKLADGVWNNERRSAVALVAYVCGTEEDK